MGQSGLADCNTDLAFSDKAGKHIVQIPLLLSTRGVILNTGYISPQCGESIVPCTFLHTVDINFHSIDAFSTPWIFSALDEIVLMAEYR